MIHTDYPIGALSILLDGSCLSERYAPLLPYKDRLPDALRRLGCRVKSDAERLPDEVLSEAGLCDPQTVRLFRRFLTLYDPKPQKFRELAAVEDPEERAVFRELYYLPGVKQIRASLYCQSGYRSLRDFVDTTAEEVLARTARIIADRQLSCIVPLPKEVRTHIAVARAFTRDDFT